MIQSLVLSFLLGGIIVLTFALVDEKIYQEHQFAFIFLLSTFVLLFEFISLLSLCQSDESLVRHFLFFFYLFSGWRNSNFSDDNCLFSVGRCFSSSLLDCLRYVYSFAFFRNHFEVNWLIWIWFHSFLWERIWKIFKETHLCLFCYICSD